MPPFEQGLTLAALLACTLVCGVAWGYWWACLVDRARVVPMVQAEVLRLARRIASLEARQDLAEVCTQGVAARVLILERAGDTVVARLSTLCADSAPAGEDGHDE